VLGNEDQSAPNSHFGRSRWFARGWTLQELLALRQVIFWSAEWIDIGTKSSLQDLVASITGIQQLVLDGTALPSAFSIAQRMSWAAGRVTTRPEDVAYSLIGIFDVNMPLLYGEGERALKRVQEEIMKDSDDHSIFACEAIPHPPPLQSLLAQMPAQFVSASSVVLLRDWTRSVLYSLTNKGLRINLFLLLRNFHPGYFWGILDYHLIDLGYPLTVKLKALTKNGDQFARVAHTKPFAFQNRSRVSRRRYL
jgi:hypothetical protein